MNQALNHVPSFAISTEAIEEYAKMVPQLLELRHLFVEFS